MTVRICLVLVGCLLALSLTGCAYQSHMREGDRQYEESNYEAALASYKKAQELKPGSDKAAARVIAAKKAAVSRWRVEAERAIRDEDWIGAVEAASEALAVAPENDQTRRLVQDVAFKAREEAQKRADVGNYARALALYEAIIEGLTTERYATEPDARQVRQTWATVLRSRAREAEGDGLHGLALINWSKAADLRPDSGYERKVATVYETVLGSARYAVCLRQKRRGVGYREVVEALEQLNLPDGLTLLTSGDAEGCDAELEFDVGQPRFDRTQSTRTETDRYQSGTRQVPNPGYERRERELNSEKQELLDAEQKVDDQREQVDRYRSQVAEEGPTPDESTGAEQNLSRAESRLEAARRGVDSQRRRVQRAYDQLDRTDRFREEAVYQEVAYTVTTHRIDGRLRLRGEIDGAQQVAIDQELGVSASDDEHPAQSSAGVPANPLTLPAEGDLVAQLYARAASHVATVLEGQFEDYRERLLRVDGNGEARQTVDALVEYLVLDPSQFEETSVQEIYELTGIPDADSLVRRASQM